MSLSGKTALVTGGATGIGYGCAVALAKAGCRVAISSRRQEALDGAVARFKNESSGGALLAHPVDVADRESVARLFRWAEGELGQIDILVNSAGVNTKRRTMGDLDPADWDRVMAINTTGVYNCMREALPAMAARKEGTIITISSVSGLRATMLGGTAYCASKFAVQALGTAVALEYGKHGIRVTNIAPGEVDTPILENRPNPVSAEHRAKILQPEDIGAACVLVASLPARAHIPELVIKPTWQDFS